MTGLLAVSYVWCLCRGIGLKKSLPIHWCSSDWARSGPGRWWGKGFASKPAGLFHWQDWFLL